MGFQSEVVKSFFFPVMLDVCVCVCVHTKSLNCVLLFATPQTVVHQAPLSMEFYRQEYYSGLSFPSPGDLLNPGIESGSPVLQADALPSGSFDLIHPNVRTTFFIRYVYIIGQKANLNLLLESLARL